MPRPSGKLNADHESKRQALAQALVHALSKAGPKRLSMRDIARELEVPVNTLQHYFGDRTGVLRAAFAAMKGMGGHYVRMTAALAEQPPAAGLRTLIRVIIEGWKPGLLAGAHGAGLSEGLGESEIGPAYVNGLLEPILQTVESLLAKYMEKGLLARADARIGALALLSPVIFALLHQHQLGGGKCRPLNLEQFADEHVQRFLRGWAL